MCPQGVPDPSGGIPAETSHPLFFAGSFLGHPYKIGARHSQQKRVFCVKELWEAREKPKPLQLARCLGVDGSADQNGALDGAHQAATGESACKALGITGAHRIWSLAECAKVDLQCQTYARQNCSLHSKLCLASLPESCLAPSALCSVFNSPL